MTNDEKKAAIAALARLFPSWFEANGFEDGNVTLAQ
jgi:hypothetical protein